MIWPAPPSDKVQRITNEFILPNMIAKAVTGTSTKDAIAWAEVDGTGSWVLLGDWTSQGSHHYNATRSSDIMPGHLASFAAATPIAAARAWPGCSCSR